MRQNVNSLWFTSWTGPNLSTQSDPKGLRLSYGPSLADTIEQFSFCLKADVLRLEFKDRPVNAIMEWATTCFEYRTHILFLHDFRNATSTM
jgi:hypothetical protein